MCIRDRNDGPEPPGDWNEHPVPRGARTRRRRLLKYRTVFGLMLALLTALGAPAAGWTAAEATSRDLSAARKLFEANLDAIRRRDRAAYLACYLDSESMARTGAEGFQLGFKAHAAQSTETG